MKTSLPHFKAKQAAARAAGPTPPGRKRHGDDPQPGPLVQSALDCACRREREARIARPGSLGSVLVANLFRSGFDGPIMPVHPKHAHIHSVATYIEPRHDLCAFDDARDDHVAQ